MSMGTGFKFCIHLEKDTGTSIRNLYSYPTGYIPNGYGYTYIDTPT